jgi:hypothetical protein
MMANRRLIKSIAWVAGALIAAGLTWSAVSHYFGTTVDPRSEQHLKDIAAAINRSIPVMIDKETELLPAEGHHGMLIYNYRLVSYSVSQLDYEKFAAGAKQKVTQGACSRPETRDDFLKNGVTLRYSYFDKDKRHIATIDVTPADCGF